MRPLLSAAIAVALAGCDLLVGVREVHERAPAATSAGGQGQGGAAGCSDAAACGASSDCRAYRCEAGRCAHTDRPKGAACAGGQGSCDGAGACVDLSDGASCAADAQCKNGHCAGGTCCEAPCVGACLACNHALTGAPDGQCDAVISAPDPGNCDDANGGCGAKCACDSQGACLRARGEPCAKAADCATAYCADGVCCNIACDAPCDACAKAHGAKLDGVCAHNAVRSADDPGSCDQDSGGANTNAGGKCDAAPCSCDDAGVCKGKLGSDCVGLGSHCLSGNCCGKCCP